MGTPSFFCLHDWSYRHFWWSTSIHNTWVRLVIGMVRLIQVQTACDSAPQESTTLPTQQLCLEIFPSHGIVHGITFRFEETGPGYFLRGCSSWMSVSVCQAQTDEPSDHHRTDGSCYLLLLSSVHLLVLKNLILAGYNQFARSLGWNITILVFLLPLFDFNLYSIYSIGLWWALLGCAGLFLGSSGPYWSLLGWAGPNICFIDHLHI